MSHSVLRKAGFLTYEQNGVNHNVTDKAAQFLMTPVEIEEGFTLLDLLCIIKVNPILHEVFKRDWINDYLKTAFSPESMPQKNEDIEYLEIYNFWERNTETNVVEGTHVYGFHGVGKVLEKDSTGDEGVAVSKGRRIMYGVEFMDIRSIMQLPIVYTSKIAINEGCSTDWQKYGKKIDDIIIERPTLAEVIQAVFYEMSWHGSPDESAEKMAKNEEDLIKSLEGRRTN